MAFFSTARTSRRSKAAMRAVAIGGLAVLLAGCYRSQEAADIYPNDYRLRHPITLRDGQHAVEVFLGRNRGGLSPEQRADVMSFAGNWKRQGTSGILVEVPNNSATKRAASDSLREIHSILNANGVPRHGVRVRSYASASPPSIKLSYARLTATAGPCGLWPHDLGVDNDPVYQENLNFWNMGCASQRNLAAMVDNPADLVQPRGETPAYQARRSVAMDKYRKGEIPSGTYPSDGSHGYDSSKLSDVGK
jgi:pilus assembly protein CpaD